MKNGHDSLERAHKIVEAAMDKSGLSPVLLDLTEQRSYADYLAIVSVKSERQLRAVADHVVERMAEEGVRPIGVEGRREGRWALVDFGDVVLHVFQHELRGHYDIEGLWGEDAKQVPLQIPPDLRIQSQELDADLGYSLAD